MGKVSIIVTVSEGNVPFREGGGQTSPPPKVDVCCVVKGRLINFNGGKEGRKVTVRVTNESTRAGRVTVIKDGHNKKVQGLQAFCRVPDSVEEKRNVGVIFGSPKRNEKGQAILVNFRLQNLTGDTLPEGGSVDTIIKKKGTKKEK